MMTLRRKLALHCTAFLTLAFLLTACIHKQGGTPVTPLEKVATYSATFAETNQAIEQGAEALAASGVLPKDKAQLLISFNYRAADVHQQITQVLGKGSAITAADQASLTALLEQIKASGVQLVGDGSLGVKNPKSQNTIAQDIQALVDLSETILALIPQLSSTTATS